MEEILSFETSFLTRPTQRHTPVDAMYHGHCYENSKFSITVVLVQNYDFWKVYFSTIKVPTFLKNNPHISFGEIAV
jgi:hypothetical protein